MVDTNYTLFLRKPKELGIIRKETVGYLLGRAGWTVCGGGGQLGALGGRDVRQ